MKNFKTVLPLTWPCKLLTAIILLFHFTGHSQFSIGLKYGQAWNRVPYRTTAFSFVREPQWQDGISINVSGMYQAKNNPLFVSFDLGYIEKNQRTERQNGLNNGDYTQITRNYIEARLFANGKLDLGRFQIFGGAGLYGSYLVSARFKTKTRTLEISRSDLFNAIQRPGTSFDDLILSREFKGKLPIDKSFEGDNRKDNRLDFGLALRTGIGYSFKRFTITGEYGYLHGISNLEIFKNENPIDYRNQYNRSHYFQLGLFYSIGKKVAKPIF